MRTNIFSTIPFLGFNKTPQQAIDAAVLKSNDNSIPYSEREAQRTYIDNIKFYYKDELNNKDLTNDKA